jgi:hypothetical protein
MKSRGNPEMGKTLRTEETDSAMVSDLSQKSLGSQVRLTVTQ